MTATTSLLKGTVAVTGAGGFVGRHVVAYLASRYEQVHALLGPGDCAPNWPENVAIQVLDVTDARQVQLTVGSVDAIVHLAGPPGATDSFAQPQHYINVHMGGTENIVQALGAQTRLVYVSSAEVYGQPERDWVDEAAVLAPVSPYGAAKCGAESVIASHARAHQVNAVILRPFSIVGPGQSPHSFLANVFSQLLCDQSRVEVHIGDASLVRDYVAIEDVVRGIDKALRLPLQHASSPDVFNLCSGAGVSAAELVRLAGRIVGKEIILSQRVATESPAGGVVTRVVGDPEKAHKQLGWHSSTNLCNALQSAFDWSPHIARLSPMLGSRTR